MTISYGQLKVLGQPAFENIVNIPNAQFSEEDDPTRGVCVCVCVCVCVHRLITFHNVTNL